MDDAAYIFAAFAAVWVALFGYILFLFLTQKGLQRDVALLEKEVSKLEDR